MKRFFTQKYEAVLLIAIAALFVLSMPAPAHAAGYTYQSIANTPGILVKIDQVTGRIVDIVDANGRSVALMTNSGSGTLTGGVVTAITGAGSFTTLAASNTVTLSPANTTVTISPTGTGTVAISPVGALTVNPTAASTLNNTSVGATTASTGKFTTLTKTSEVVVSTGRAVLIGTTSDTLPASITTTFESNNTGSGAFTVTLAAPTGDGEHRRICFNNLTGTITWTVTGPATATSGLPTTMAADSCIEMVYNSVAGTPTNSAATTWYQY
jgi:hypothetical protein